MTKTKFIILGLMLLMIFSVFIGCSNNKYNAKMYSMSTEWVLTSFLENNKVGGAYYKNPDYTEDEDNSVEKYLFDNNSPESRTVIVDNQESFDTTFEKDKLEVDFSKEIIYLYIFADTYPNREYYIDDILIETQNLSIYFKVKNNNKNDSTAPYQRCLIVKMEKTNTLNVEFVKQS